MWDFLWNLRVWKLEITVRNCFPKISVLQCAKFFSRATFALSENIQFVYELSVLLLEPLRLQKQYNFTGGRRNLRKEKNVNLLWLQVVICEWRLTVPEASRLFWVDSHVSFTAIHCHFAPSLGAWKLANKKGSWNVIKVSPLLKIAKEIHVWSGTV